MLFKNLLKIVAGTSTTLLLIPLIGLAQTTFSSSDILSKFPQMTPAEAEQVYQRMLFDKIDINDTEKVSTIVNELIADKAAGAELISFGSVSAVKNGDENYDVSFTLNNSGPAIGGLKYKVSLHPIDEISSKINWSHQSTEDFAMAQSGSVSLNTSVSLPKNANGSYLFVIEVGDESGLVYAAEYINEPVVTVSGSLFPAMIDTGSCYLTIGEDNEIKYTLSQGIDVATSESLNLHCLVKNTDSSDLSLEPNFVSHVRNTWGRKVADNKADSTIALKAGEEKEVVVSVPLQGEPQAYDAVLSFKNGGVVVSDTLEIHYVIQGESATIQELVLDKAAYKAGETASVGLAWTGRADSFLESRVSENSNISLGQLFANVYVSNGEGMVCGYIENQLLSEEIEYAGNVNLSLPISVDCKNIELSANIKNSEGKVLFETKRSLASVEDTQSADDTKDSDTLFLVSLIAIAIAGVAALIMWSRKHHNDKIVASLLFITVLVGVTGFWTVSNATFIRWYMFDARAAAWNTNHAVDTTHYGPSGTYTSASVIVAGMNVTNRGCANALVRSSYTITLYRSGSATPVKVSNLSGGTNEKASFSDTYTNLPSGNYRADVVWTDVGCTRIPNPNYPSYPPRTLSTGTGYGGGWCNIIPSDARSYYFTVDNPAIGYFDAATASNCSVSGWAYDRDSSASSIPVHIYRDGPAGTGTFVTSCIANQPRPDVNTAQGITGNHGFNCALPASYQGIGSHNLYIHAIDTTGAPNNVITQSPRALNCTAMSATIIGTNCDIPVGASSCSGTVTWTTTGAVSPNVYNVTSGSQFSTSPSGTSQLITLARGTNQLQVRDGSSSLNSTNLVVDCASGSTWNGSICASTSASASISGGGCQIALGDSTCDGTVTWNISNSGSPSVYNFTRGVVHSNNASGNNESIALTYGTNQILARGGATTLDAVNLSTTCASGSWDGTQCANIPASPSINLSLDREIVRSGSVSNLTVDVNAGYPTACTVEGLTSSAFTFTHSGSPAASSNTFASDPLTSAKVITVSCEPDPEIAGVAPATAEIRVSVIPVVEEI